VFRAAGGLTPAPASSPWHSPVTMSEPQPRHESAPSSGRARLAAAAMAIAGFALTIVALYPGYLTNDATYVYSYVQDWHLGDWQSPLLTMIWWLIDPIAPGSGSMFLLTAAFYWLGFGTLAVTVARRSALLGVIVPLLGLTPPAFILLAMIWRDILFSGVWLLAAALVYAVAERGAALRLGVQVVAVALIALGVLLRPNAFAAAPFLLAYAIWPTRIEWKRTALLFVPALIAGYGLVHLVYYEMLHVKRENPLHSLLVFDLGGISYFTKENQFPVDRSPQETALLIDRCYEPWHWDIYWTLDPCKFVMARLERPGDVIFGTQRLSDAWLHAVTAHPLAYIEHRVTVLWTFLVPPNLTLEVYKLGLPDETPIACNPYFMALLPVHDALASGILYRAGLWFVLSAATLLWAWPARAAASGAFAVAIAAAGLAYVLTFGLIGVATDFRYDHWGVVAGLAGLAPALMARRDMRVAARVSALASA
jgi:hypothetical protein